MVCWGYFCFKDKNLGHHLDPTVMVLITNSKDFKNIETAEGKVDSGKEIIAIQNEVSPKPDLAIQ